MVAPLGEIRAVLGEERLADGGIQIHAVRKQAAPVDEDHRQAGRTARFGHAASVGIGGVESIVYGRVHIGGGDAHAAPFLEQVGVFQMVTLAGFLDVHADERALLQEGCVGGRRRLRRGPWGQAGHNEQPAPVLEGGHGRGHENQRSLTM